MGNLEGGAHRVPGLPLPAPRKVHIQGGAKRLENTRLSGFGLAPPVDTAAHKVSDVPSGSQSDAGKQAGAVSQKQGCSHPVGGRK